MAPETAPHSPVTRASLYDLVTATLARLTDDECVSLLHQVNPAMPHHGLAEFHTGAEALHGVAWTGTATVFPQPVGMAAAWDASLLRELGEATSTEVRAKHAADPVGMSLNVWAPVVNPLRHPLWGRNEEGYSEDPHVTAECAIAYSSGLRGDHSVFWKTVPTLKHLLAYNNEQDRCTSSSSLPPRVLHEYDLPPFVEPIAAGVVGGVMAAYNLVNGRPAHTSPELFEAVRAANPDLLAVSDAYAPTNLTGAERAYATEAESHAAAILAGLDSFTDHDADSSHTLAAIRGGLAQGLLTMDDVRRAARRVLLVRALTGELTPEADPYAHIGADEIDTPAHRDLARRASAAQVTVLANDGVLPLAPGARVAVVGPMAEVVKHDWYSGTPPYMVTVADAAAETHAVVAHDGADRVVLRSRTTGLAVSRAADGVLVADQGHDAEASTFAVVEWGSDVVTLRHDATGLLWRGSDEGMVRVDSTRPGGWVTHEHFVRHLHDDGSWSLQHRGSRRWLRVESWGGLVSSSSDDLATAERFDVEILSGGVDEVARAAADADVVLVAVGNDPHLNGRETVDRPELALPAAQVAVVEAALAANPATVLVVVSSYPYALGSLAEEAAAVVWSSHAGQELGHGLMDVLDGRVEPTGRLAQTWWAEEAHAGSMFDYDIIDARMTWWYSPHTPLYALGHGLTYGAVEYLTLELPDGLDGAARVSVANRGPRPAHELVQVYAESADERIGRRLLGHARIVVAPGTEATAEVALHPKRLRIWSGAEAGMDLPATTWRIVAAPSAAMSGPELTLTTAPGRSVGPAALPLDAWQAPDWSGVVGVAVDTLRDNGYRARAGAGRLVWPAVEPLPARLTLRLRVATGLGGEVEVRCGGASTVAIPDPALRGQWHDVIVDCPDPGATTLELALGGTVELAEIRAAR